MSTVNVEYINPFIEASKNILKDVCQISIQLDKPYLKEPKYKGNFILIIIGVTGEIRGQVVISLKEETGCLLASKMMMGMSVPELNDMAKSAISELANIVLGNAATLFSKKGISLDITPPSICLGDNISISVNHTPSICIPLAIDENNKIELNVAIEKA